MISYYTIPGQKGNTMDDCTVRNIEISELRDIYKHIKADFAKGEYAPYEVLKKQIQNGVQEGLILQKAEDDVAYAICAGGHENGYVLISLLAVYGQFRKSGFGTAFVEEIKSRYKGKNGIIVEVEKPEEAPDPEEKRVRLKRIEFYERAGFYRIPDIDYSIWDVPMHLMAFPQKAGAAAINNEIGQIMYEIYLQLMSESYIHKLKIHHTK